MKRELPAHALGAPAKPFAETFSAETVLLNQYFPDAQKEARILARLAWNNWPDNENSRREIAAHEARDPVSAEAWDRVVVSIWRATRP